MRCAHCQSPSITQGQGRTAHGCRRFHCQNCGRRFNERTGTVLNWVQMPTYIFIFGDFL
jgi:putative transposase